MVYNMQIMSCKYLWFTGLLFVSLVFQSYAQEGGDARIYHAEGGEFILAAGGQRTVYQPASLGEGGFSLHNGDIIQTGPESFVEIRLSPGGKVIRIAENTFLSYNRTNGEGISLGLSYGRLRLSDGKGGFGGGEVFIRSGTAEVVFQNGDIGVDYTVQPAGENPRQSPVLRVYVFSGAAALIPLIREPLRDYTGTAPEVARFQINEAEEAAVENSPSLSYVERKPLNKDITAYWDGHPSAAFPLFSQAEPLPPSEIFSVPESPVQAPAGGNWTITPGYNPFIRSNAAKNSCVIAGFSVSLIGAVLQGLAQSDWNSNNAANRDMNRYAGYGFLGAGALFFSAALFINPKLPGSDASK
jgi:hypothetical protein